MAQEKASTIDQHRSLFPTIIPNEVKKLTLTAKTIQKQIFRKYIKIALAYIQQSQNEADLESAFDSIFNAMECTTEEEIWNAVEQYTGIITLLRSLLRLQAKTVRQQHLETELICLGFREDQAADLCKIVLGPARQKIDEKLTSNAPTLPSLSVVDWKLQLAVAKIDKPHVIEPVIVMDVKTSNNKEDNASVEESHSHKLSLTVQQFHQLRYSVANLLHQMESLETLPGGAKYNTITQTFN